MSRRIAFVMNTQTTRQSGLLRYGSRDAEEMFRLLTCPRLGACDPQRSRLLTACRGPARFHAAFVRGLLKNWAPEDQLIFYFSGHGLLQNDLFSLQLGPENTDALPFNSLINTLQQFLVQRFILILDACHSGAATAKASRTAQIDQQLQQVPPGGAIIASCEQWQFSKEYDPAGMSLFTWLLKRSMEAGCPQDPERDWLTVEEVLQGVELDLCRPEFSGLQQHPRRKVFDAGARLPFVRNAAYREGPPEESSRRSTAFLDVLWSQAVINTPLEPADIARLRPLLVKLRKLVWAQLREIRPQHALPLSQIRVTLFFPQVDPVPGSGLFLTSEEGLRCGGRLISELEFSVSPGQGTTGLAYAKMQPVLAIRRTRRVRDREALQSLSGVQWKRLHPRLRWVLSLPVSDSQTGSPLAVANLEGLERGFQEEELLGLLPVLEESLSALSSLVSELPRMQVLLGCSN